MTRRSISESIIAILDSIRYKPQLMTHIAQNTRMNQTLVNELIEKLIIRTFITRQILRKKRTNYVLTPNGLTALRKLKKAQHLTNSILEAS